MPASPKNRLGLVLSAGGARAAYQVGVLRHLGTHMPRFQPKIFAGISAGSINAAFLSQGQSIREATHRMCELWTALRYDDVFKTNFNSMFSIFGRLFYDLFVSKITRKHLFNAIFDATPLSHTLIRNVNFAKVHSAVRAGLVDGIAVSTTNYNTGENTVFYDSFDPIEPWRRKRRVAIRTPIRIRHIMASCSLPILFDAVRIGDYFFGDGAIRFAYPLSPAIHLGASHILTVGISSGTVVPTPPPADQKTLSMGPVAGVVLNSIFIDALETDYENLLKINEMIGESSRLRRIDVHMLRPSKDLGHLAENFLDDIPFHFRQLLKASAFSATELGDLVSYLMFSREYIHALIQLGEKDAEREHASIEEFLKQGATAG